MYGFIYITTNNVNGKKYIGQRKYDKYGKWKEYLGSGITLSRSIEKYGIQNFTKEIIEECETRELLNQREIYWINFYDAVKSNNFYNIAKGGDGGNTIAGYSDIQLKQYKEFKSKLHKQTALKGEASPSSKLTEKQVSEIIQRFKNNDFNSDIANDYSVSVATINDIRNHKTWTHLTKGIIFDDISKRSRSGNIKPVVQYDEAGKYIATYKSARMAEKETGIGFKLISSVCKGQKRIAHGYIWRFEGDLFDKYSTINSYMVRIDQYDKNGNYIKTWSSIKEVEDTIGIKISSVLYGVCHSAGGFYWCRHGKKFSIPKYKITSRKPA